MERNASKTSAQRDSSIIFPNNPFHLLTIPLSLSPSLLCMAFWKETANYKFRRSLLSYSVESRKVWKFSFIQFALSIGFTNIANRGDILNLPVTNQWINASALTRNISIFHKFSDAEEAILNSFIQKWMLAFLPCVQKYVLKKLHFSFQQVIRSLSSARTIQAQNHKFWLLEHRVSAAFTSFEEIDFSVYNFLAHVVLHLYN